MGKAASTAEDHRDRDSVKVVIPEHSVLARGQGGSTVGYLIPHPLILARFPHDNSFLGV